MKYLITNLSIGEEYLNSSIDLFTSLSKILPCDFNITTNDKRENLDRINFDYIYLNRYNDNLPGASFFYGLKSLALKYGIDKGYDFIIYIDSDWEITKNLTEKKILDLLDYIKNDNNLDALLERPANIGYTKKNMDQCFFKEKLDDFNVFEHNKWDDAQVINEQFMVFKYNWKFKFFIMKWEQMLWYSIANNIRSYPEGFDAGVSMVESEINTDFITWKQFVTNCFQFKDKEGKIYYRF